MQVTAKKIFEVVCGVGALGVALGVYFWGGKAENTADKRVRAMPVVEIAALGTQNWENAVEALGTAIANESVDLSAGASEKVKTINFTDAQWVKRGTVLVELEKNEELAELNQAEVNLEKEKREYERFKRLLDSKAIAEKEFDAQNSAYELAKTVKAVVEAKISDRTIIAPFDGILGNRQVSVGDLVTPGTIVTTLDDISIIKVDFNVPEKYFAKLHSGLEFSVSSIAYPGRKFTGKITAIGARLNSVTRSVQVRGVIENPREGNKWLLHPGMLLVVNLNLGSYEAVVIPEKSILSLGEMQYIFLYADDNTVTRREVKLGTRKDGYAEILNDGVKNPLKAGDRYVIEGVAKLNDGSKVEVLNSGAKGKALDGGQKEEVKK